MTQLDLLILIAEGNDCKGFEDRYVQVANPKYKEDNGENPFFVFDAYTGEIT